MSRFAVKPRTRPFSWSYSKLKNFEACGRRHHHIDILKDFHEEEGPELKDGNEAHDVLSKAINGAPLPEKFQKQQPWIDRLLPSGRENERVYTELKLALKVDKSACEFFGNGAWFRGVIDYIKIVETSAGAVALLVDWKTGKVLEDSVQLALFAAMAFAHYPQLVKVRTEYVWLKANETTREDFTRADMVDLWASLAPRIEAMEHAHTSGQYLPLSGRLCRKYCPVTSCEYHGK